MSENREPETTAPRRCAFCDAPWSAAMTAWMGGEPGCACCGGTVLGHWPIAAALTPAQSEDLVCHACGKTLYLAPDHA